jgi:glycosyltransferase involved in cell wall biosynthesis
MKPLGGSEIVYNNIKKYVTNIDDINLILSTCSFDILDPEKSNVIYQELSYDQENVQLMANPEFVNAVDYFVFVSHWQYEKFRMVFNVPPHKCAVIKNAVDYIDPIEREKCDKIKLIYTSTPWRGLNVLLKSFELLSRNDTELHVYSSVIIYGDDFATEAQQKLYQPLFDKAKSMKNVIYHGYAPNEEIRKALNESHIFSYPSTFEETSCISAIEAGLSGCRLVCSNYGALYETCADFADYIIFNPDLNEMAKNYAEKLNKAINNYWNEFDQERLQDQVKYFNRYYTWGNRIIEWENFIEKIKSTAFTP